MGVPGWWSPVLARDGNGWSGWSMGKTSIFSENSLSTYYMPDTVAGAPQKLLPLFSAIKSRVPKGASWGKEGFSRLALPGPSGWAAKALIQLRKACCLGCCSCFKGYSYGTSWAGVLGPFPVHKPLPLTFISSSASLLPISLCFMFQRC